MGPILALTATLAAPLRPHIVYLLADDFGWADADWHHPEGSTDPLATPHMSDLISQGIELGQHYSFKFCSPTRSSIQSGRNPIHVNVQNYQPVVWNWREPNKDPDAGFAGMARNMTGVGNVMKNAGYSTVMAGKWDVGMATPDHTPKARGYDSSLFYFHHDNDYWSSRVRVDDRVHTCPGHSDMLVDLWGDEAPASTLNNSYDLCEPKGGAAYPNAPNGSCVYEDELFVEHVLNAIQGHKEEAGPLFVFWAAHSVHAPLQVPKPFLDMYEDKVKDNRRARYLAMVRWLDSALQRVTDALKGKGMWEETLLVFTSDNGGPVYFGGSAGANNFPLRGGKTSNFQGGIHINAFVSGGVLPPAVRGKKLDGLSAVWDWYATFADLAGADPTDKRAAAAGLPPIDSLSLWPYLSGASKTSPRKEIPVGSSSCASAPEAPYSCINQWGWGNVSTVVAGLVMDEGEEGVWKLLLGKQTMDGWQGPMYPNASTAKSDFGFNAAFTHDCGDTGCLFRVDTDPSEYVDLLAAAQPSASTLARAARMRTALAGHNATAFSPDRGTGEADGHITEACDAALNRYGGFFGPFLDLE